VIQTVVASIGSTSIRLAPQEVEKTTTTGAKDAHGGSHGFNPLEPSWGLFFWSAVTFVILFILLAKFAWGPITKLVEQREKKIKGDIERAELARAEAEAALKRHEAQLAEAAQAARETVEAARVRAEQAAASIATAAKAEGESILAKARTQIEADKQKALSDIKTAVVELSMAVTREVVKRTAREEDHQKIADDLIRHVKGA
jgi:F-type H+-transporting ATPase subunit b